MSIVFTKNMNNIQGGFNYKTKKYSKAIYHVHRYAWLFHYKTPDSLPKILSDVRKFNYKTFQRFEISIIKHSNTSKIQL